MRRYINNRENNEKATWMPTFTNPTQYVEVKLEMLRGDMYINPTKEEIEHLYTLTSRCDIDNAVHSIIDRHWDKY